jgi:hypothetical protein
LSAALGSGSAVAVWPKTVAGGSVTRASSRAVRQPALVIQARRTVPTGLGRPKKWSMMVRLSKKLETRKMNYERA